MWSVLKESFDNLKLKNKFIIPTMILVTVIIGVIANVVANYFYRTISNNYFLISEKMLDILEIQVEEYIESRLEISDSLQTDVFFYPEYYAASDDYKGYNYKIKKLLNMYLRKEDMHSIMLYIPKNEEVYVVNKKLNLSFANAEEMEACEWYQKTLAAGDQLYIALSHQLEGYDRRYALDEERVFSIGKSIIWNDAIYGVLLVNYREEGIRSILNAYEVYPDAAIFLYDEKGIEHIGSNNLKYSITSEQVQKYILASPEDNGVFYYTDEEDGEEVIAMYRKTSKGQVLVQLITKQMLISSISHLKYINILLTTIALGVLGICIIMVSSSITKPLMYLRNSLQRFAEGDFKVKLEVKSRDEIGDIIHTFNEMVERINTLINEQYRLELENKEAHLKQLIAQINPHFLYNTLESIGSLACENGVEEVQNQLQQLADIFRYAIKTSSEVVELQLEIENTLKYLEIQKFRFEERLNYTIDVQEGLCDVMVPKLLLQPIVENAIVHGIEKKKYNGKVEVHVYRQGYYDVIEVRDNCGGMQGDTLGALQEVFDKKRVSKMKQTNSIGLMNIFNRLVLRYNENFEMRALNNAEGGLTVQIMLSRGGEEKRCIV